MRSSNPVLTRSDAFTRGGYATFDNTLSDRDLQAMYDAPAATPVRTAVMTIDDVVAKTALTLLTLVVAGGITWAVLEPRALGIPVIASLVGFVVAMVITFKRAINPALVLAYAAIEGVFLGGWSHYFNARYGGGIVVAYRAGVLRATPRFTRILVGATIGFLLLGLTNFVLALVGVDGGQGLGLRDMGAKGFLFGLAGAVLASLFLVLDFDQIERGVKAGAPERESWRAAFGLTVTLVWLYLEILRLLAILRGDN
jgi:uncharacterized YccA/Bax inhibitor family protein